MKKDVDHIIRSAFEGENNDKAPNMVWSAIDEELSKSEIDATVKKSFEAQQEIAPELVWERVQNQLDIDRVWIRLAHRVNFRKQRYFLRYTAALLILLLPFHLDLPNSSFIFGALNENSSNSTEQPSFVDEETFDVNNSDDNISNNTTTNQLDGMNYHVAAGDVNIGQVNNGHSINNQVDSDLITLDEKPNELTYLNAKLAKLPLVVLDNPLNPQIQSLYTPKRKHNVGVMLGVVATLDNTWILDNETRSGFDSGSLVENEFTLGSSYGVFTEYQLKPRFSIAAEYLFQTRSNQRLHNYYNGKYVYKEREINSYKLSMMLGWNSLPKYNGVSHSTVIKLGGYYTGVKSDYTRINGIITDVNSIHKQHDAGLRFEVGKRIYLKSFMLDGGVRADYGLLNLASTKSSIPADLNFTRLISTDLYLKVAYVF